MNTFVTAVPSRYSNREICLKPFELEDTMFHQSHRVVENRAIRHIDHNPALLKFIKTMGEKERKENRSRLLQTLKKRHQDYLADTRKALSDCHSKRALYVLVDEMAEHDKALAAKAGREFCNTFEELERAIESVEQRLNGKKVEPVFMLGLDPAAVVKSQIRNRGSVRLEKMEEGKRTKVKYVVSFHQCMEALNHGWNMEMVR